MSNISNEIKQALINKAKSIEKKMKSLANFRNGTGALNRSISFVYDTKKREFIFSALYYGKFQDEGTYKNNKPTKTSKRVWPPYKPKGRGRQGTGIKGKHFTEPMAQFGKKELVSIVKPILIKELKQKALKLIKDTNVSSITKT